MALVKLFEIDKENFYSHKITEILPLFSIHNKSK